MIEVGGLTSAADPIHPSKHGQAHTIKALSSQLKRQKPIQKAVSLCINFNIIRAKNTWSNDRQSKELVVSVQ